ncbi:MAG: hypothetical protein KDN19_07740, partial [Verrucomicrobiae bacterium]|nr:hypothetical protein [Verrucomicrobiae bacterium]
MGLIATNQVSRLRHGNFRIGWMFGALAIFIVSASAQQGADDLLGGAKPGVADQALLESLKVIPVVFDGEKARPWYAPVLPSFSHPSLALDQFEISDLHLTEDREIV